MEVFQEVADSGLSADKRDEDILIDNLEEYIGEHGLPQEFAGVMK